MLGLDVEKKCLDRRGGIPLLVEVEGEVFNVFGRNGAITIIKIGEDVADGFTAESTLADGHVGLVLVGDDSVNRLFDDTVDDFVVGPKDEGRCVLGLDDGTIVVVEEQGDVVGVANIIVGASAGIRGLDIRVGLGHGVFASVHEDAGVSHSSCIGIRDGDCFGDALVFQRSDGVYVGDRKSVV